MPQKHCSAAALQKLSFLKGCGLPILLVIKMERIGKGMFAVFSMLLLLGVNFASAQAAQTQAYQGTRAVQASSGTGVIAQDNAGVQASSDTDAQKTMPPRWYGGGLDFAIMEADDYSLEVGQGTYVYIYAYDASGKATPEEGTEVKISVRDSCDRGAICVAVVRASPVGKVEYDAQHGRYVAKFSTIVPDRYMLYATITKGADEIFAGPRDITVNVPLQNNAVCARMCKQGSPDGNCSCPEDKISIVPKLAELPEQAIVPKQAHPPVQQICPQIMPPSPNFCKNGAIVSGGIDKNGCYLPPKCITTEQSIVKEAESKVVVKEENAQPPKEARGVSALHISETKASRSNEMHSIYALVENSGKDSREFLVRIEVVPICAQYEACAFLADSHEKEMKLAAGAKEAVVFSVTKGKLLGAGREYVALITLLEDGKTVDSKKVKLGVSQQEELLQEQALPGPTVSQVPPMALPESVASPMPPIQKPGNKELLATIERLIAELLTLRMQLLASS